MPVRVKICGLRDAAHVRDAAEAGASFAGFVHYAPSPRHVEFSAMATLIALLPPAVTPVAVLVAPTDDALQSAADAGAAYFQLHGNETVERIAAIRRRFPKTGIIRALRVRGAADLEVQPSASDVLMFDAPPPAGAALPGGNGVAFDWALLKDRSFVLPWMLSGGLTPENVARAIAQSGAAMVDVSSGVESAPGVKDSTLIRQFLRNALYS